MGMEHRQGWWFQRVQICADKKSDMFGFGSTWGRISTNLPCCPLNNPRVKYFEPLYTLGVFFSRGPSSHRAAVPFSGRNTWQIFDIWPKRYVKREIKYSLVKMLEAANHH